MTNSIPFYVIADGAITALRRFRQRREQKRAEFALRFLSHRQLSDVGLNCSDIIVPG